MKFFVWIAISLFSVNSAFADSAETMAIVHDSLIECSELSRVFTENQTSLKEIAESVCLSGNIRTYRVMVKLINNYIDDNSLESKLKIDLSKEETLCADYTDPIANSKCKVIALKGALANKGVLPSLLEKAKLGQQSANGAL